MTESEYKEQSERLKKFKSAQDEISAIENRKAKIRNGILSINCDYNKEVDFKYFGDDFEERLINNITSFLDSEIETIRKSMEDI